MIPYNTDLEKLVLPEYGRLVHEMVGLCSQLQDRGERNAMASTIVETMKSMTQEKGKQPDDRKYWDHLFVISGYTLDVDSPYGKPQEKIEDIKPEKIPYTSSDFGRRHYGKILQEMISEISRMPNSENKDACVELIANHIKKLLVINNSEHADDRQVFSDLTAMSRGSIAIGEGIFDIPEFKEDKATKNQKRKKVR